MANRRVAKTQQSVVDTAADAVEPMVIAMAEQLGTFLGRMQKHADEWLENPALRQQVSQIREGATQLLARVNRGVRQGSRQAGAAARTSAAKVMPVEKRSAKKAKRAAKPAHRKTAETADLFDPRLGEPMGAQVRQKAKRRRRS